MNIQKLKFLLILVHLLGTLCILKLEVFAEDINKTLILDSAEKLFISLKERHYKTAWELLSEKSRQTIIDDVYRALKNSGITIEKEEIIRDFNTNGVMFNNYWNAFLNNFDPDIALNERVWEFEKIESDHAIILLKNRAVITKLQMYKENSQWRVGLVETFWMSKTMKIIKYLQSLFLSR
jgi:hypothetical protein